MYLYAPKHQMNSQLTDTFIPSYTLQQVNPAHSRMFELLELKGQFKQHPEIFLAPHRKDYYLLVLVKQGSSRHWVDMALYTLKPDTFYFSVPLQVHVKEQAEPLIGTMLCFTDEFLALAENESLRQMPIIQNIHNGHELNLDAGNVAFIEDIFAKMLLEFNQRNDWRNSMLLAYLRILVIYLSRLYTEQFSQAQTGDRLLLKKFRALIDVHFGELHDVAAYSDLLYISAGHLSEVVKQQSGKTAIEHIHERLLLEAQRLLFHTEYSVKEIAFRLGFEDASYFNRFFKRLNGQTPAMYRKLSREMYH